MKFFTPFIVASALICLPTVLVAGEQEAADEKPFSYVSKHDGITYWDSPDHWQTNLQAYFFVSRMESYVQNKEAYVKEYEENKKLHIYNHNFISGYVALLGTLPTMFLVAPIGQVFNWSFGKILTFCAFGSVTIGGGYYFCADPYPKGFFEDPEGKLKRRLIGDMKKEMEDQAFLTQNGFYPHGVGELGEKTVNKFIDSVLNYDIKKQ